jgi:CheY-like chemotaxis protein
MKLYMPRTMQVEDTLTDASAIPPTGGTETVLVVEDDDGVRDTSVALLSDLGYRVLKAHDAQSAFAIVNSGMKIDLLFTDVVMPGPMRSVELARKAKALLPGMAVLYTSGYTENSIVHGGRLDAGVELLSKPYTREALARKVRHVLANAQQHRIALERLNRQDQASEPIASETGTVLVVEDEPLILMSTVDMVEELGYTVLEASSAEVALSIFETETIDVLFTDVGLPGMSGTDLARTIRERRPEVQIVFASGDSNAKSISGLEDALQLPKPFALEQLKAILAQARSRK